LLPPPYPAPVLPPEGWPFAADTHPDWVEVTVLLTLKLLDLPVEL
jgi:hypothetical protein